MSARRCHPMAGTSCTDRCAQLSRPICPGASDLSGRACNPGRTSQCRAPGCGANCATAAARPGRSCCGRGRHRAGDRPGMVRRAAARRRIDRRSRRLVAAVGWLRRAALLRAALAVIAERMAFDAGAAARRRLRSDALSRLLQAGPAQLREQHSGELTATVVDRIEALDGLFARWLPASMLAVAGPLLVALAALAGRPAGRRWCWSVRAAGAGRHGGCRHRRGRRVAPPVPGARAAAGALPRPHAWYRDHRAVRAGGGRGTRRSPAAADELRRRTMRVLRVAFLSSAALDLAAAFAFVVMALRYGMALLARRRCAARRCAVRPAAGARVLRATARLRRGLPGPAARHRRRGGAGRSAAAAATAAGSARCGRWRHAA